MIIRYGENALTVIDTVKRRIAEIKSSLPDGVEFVTTYDRSELIEDAVATLKPRTQWRTGLTWDGLIKDMDEKLHFPGMPNIWWMPIQTRTEMLATGVRSPLGIEVFGDDLAAIEQAALAVEKTVTKVPGTRSAFAERSTGGLYIDFDIKREAAARHGLTATDVNMTVASAIGGENVSETVEGRQRYPINVRYAREYRDDPELLGRTLIGTPTRRADSDLTGRLDPQRARSADDP